MVVASGFRTLLRLRVKAAMALRAYRRAEARYHALQERKDALEAEERVILHIWATKLSKPSFRPSDNEGFQAAYLSLTERRIELFEPWRAANTDLISAYEQAQRVLQEINSSLREALDVSRCVPTGDIVTENRQ